MRTEVSCVWYHGSVSININKNSSHLIYNTSLDWVTLFNYLGVLIDIHLKWNEHENQVSSKATKIHQPPEGRNRQGSEDQNVLITRT